MDNNRHPLYYSSLLSESPSVRDSTSRHANRFLNQSFEMSSFNLLSTSAVNQSVFLNPLANETINTNRGMDSMAVLNFDDGPDEEEEESLSLNSSLTLFQQFFEVHQKLGLNDDNIFDIMNEFELLCCDHLSVTADLLKAKVRTSDESENMSKLESVLRLERNTWRLVHALSEDRIRFPGEESDEMIVDNIITKMSDKELIEKTFEVNSEMRRMQIVIDWLERNQMDDNEEVNGDKIQFYSEGPYSWENTLHSLKTKTQNYAKERQLCEQMDPDGPIRSRRPLHDLDVEDESRLYRHIFQLVRSGQLEDGKDVARRLGYHWLAAALDGWLLHHDPNYTNDLSTHKVLEPIEGNANRDLWKYVCWRASRTEGTNIHERALFGALSGNVAAVLPLCSRWSDKLWAYFRCALDVHVEHELRQTLVVKPEAKPRSRVDLPDTYWDNKLTSAEIFREIESRISVSGAPEERYHQNVQKFFVLEDIEGLIDYVYECAKAIADSRQTKKENKCETKGQVVEPQLLRFFAHLVLALRHLNLSGNRESLCDAILEAFITYLIDRRQPELVAFYTAKLPPNKQVANFAKLLEGIEDENDRKMCIVLAKNANLDISSIAATVVDNVRSKAEEPSLEICGDLHNVTTAEDKKKINSLDWLLFSEVEQWSEALRQANALMRTFLLLRKVEATKATFVKLPQNIVDNVFTQNRRQTDRSDLNAEDDNAVREFLCHKAYLEANDAFTDWLFCLHNSKPKEPPKPTSNRFMDTVAFEHAKKQFELETHHWKEMLKKQGRLAANKIEHVLLFPDGGWMSDQRMDGPKDELRSHQLDQLRRQYIPQLVFIAHSIHKSSNNLLECVRVADMVADEEKGIYRTFSRQLVRDLLKKVRETSIEILNETTDPLGYSNN